MEGNPNNNEITPNPEAELRFVVEASAEGPGQHNFLRIVADSLSAELTSFLEQNGYTVVTIPSVEQDADKEKFVTLLHYAQSYMGQLSITSDKIPNVKKIALVISPQVRAAAMKDIYMMQDWGTNSRYMETYYLN